MSTFLNTSIQQSPSGTSPLDCRWRGIEVVVGATTATALGFGTLALMSVFIRPLEAEFGWTRAELSFSYSAATIGMALGGLFWGGVSDRVEIRTLMAIGGSGMVLSLLSMTFVQSLWQLYLANFALGGLGFSVLYTPLLGATSAWFARRRGLAVGIVTAGGALGQGALPFFANFLIDGLGWRFAFLSVATTTLVALAFALPRITHPDRAHVLAGAASSLAVGDPEGQMLRLVMLSVAGFLCCLCMGVPLVHLASFVGMICGSPAIGATSLLIAMLFGTIGRTCFGAIADRVGYLQTYALASAMQTLCVAAYPVLGDSASLMVLSAAFGFGFAGNMTCLILCVGEAVPPHRLGGALGVTFLVAWIGMGAGAYAGGVLFDSSLSYTLSFALAGLAGILNLITIGAMILARLAKGIHHMASPDAARDNGEPALLN
jgi:MFS family permease